MIDTTKSRELDRRRRMAGLSYAALSRLAGTRYDRTYFALTGGGRASAEDLDLIEGALSRAEAVTGA